ncbi:MAG: peptidase M3, partial [Candidatus Aminicenantales bacterium]
MKKSVILVCFFGLLLLSCSEQVAEKSSEENPFFTEFDTPFGVPPFDRIKEEHYLPAFQEAMTQQKDAIEKIVRNPEPPTFENTIEALEKSGHFLRRIGSVFDVLNGSMTNERMQAIAKEVAPLRSKHRDSILMNKELFQRVKIVYEKKDQLNLKAEQSMLLEKYYKDFVRGGANLDEEKKARLREINQELSVLT